MTAGFMRRLEQALTKEQLARLRSSIGLDLGTPHAEETAISTPRRSSPPAIRERHVLARPYPGRQLELRAAR